MQDRKEAWMIVALMVVTMAQVALTIWSLMR